MTTDPPVTEPDPPDSWRALAIRILGSITEDPEAGFGLTSDEWFAFNDIADALLAAEEHAPTFHVRPVWVNARGGQLPGSPKSNKQRLSWERLGVTKQWRWGARAANGEIVIPESQALEHKAWAERMAHKLADPMGARVVVDDERSGE